jgi:hypothetical protein
VSYLRLEDGFTQHPKVLALKRADRWTWLEVLTYCAHQRNGGRVPVTINEVIRCATPAFLNRCLTVGLLELASGTREPPNLVPGNHPSEYQVHDWVIYNGSLEEKIAAFLERNPSATANETVSAIGGKREVVLAIYAAQRQNARFPGTSKVVPTTGSQSVPPARARAHPTPVSKKSTTVARPPAKDLPSKIDSQTEAGFALTQLLAEVSGSDVAKARLRAFIERSSLTPAILATARDELRQAKRAGKKISNECGYVRRIVERYTDEGEPPVES